MALLASLLLAAAPVAAADAAATHHAEVERAIFEICPKVLDGSIYLGSEADAASIGYTLAPPNPKRTNVQRGSGQNAIVIWGPLKGVSKESSCIVTFAAPDITADFDAVDAAARRHGYDGAKAVRISPKARQLELTNGKRPAEMLYMLEVGGGADYLDYPTGVLVLIYVKDQ